MAVGTVTAGLTVVQFGVGKMAAGKAEREQRRHRTRLAWEEYGAATREIAKSREEQEKFYVADTSSARAKMAASGVKAGTEYWYGQLGNYQAEHLDALREIAAREDAFKDSEAFKLAVEDYEREASVSNISQQAGLKGNIRGGAPIPGRYENFSYKDYDFSDPNIPGFKGERDYDLSTIGLKSYDMDPTNNPTYANWTPGLNPDAATDLPGVNRRPDYVSQGYYEVARPTMNEFYDIRYSGDEDKKTAAQRAVGKRREEYIATYGSAIALGPYK